jgi:hypothetical protein
VSRALAAFGLLVWSAASACAPEAPHDDFPGMRLLAQVESRLEDQQAELKPMLEHYALVFPVSPADLEEFMRSVRVQGSGSDLALGNELGVESHGGGHLRLLFDCWRPESRPPTLDDRYHFEADRRDVELRLLYDAGRQQIFLPYARPTQLPPLPRMLIRWQPRTGGAQLVDSDAYKFLSLLIELEPDPAQGWSNRQAQSLSVDQLMRRVLENFLTSRPSPAGPIDHSSLHLVELLVAHGSRDPAYDFAAIREHLLSVELVQPDLDPEVAATVRAHLAESLGHLLTAPGQSWSQVDKERAKAWLRELEEKNFPDAPEDVEPLSHLGRGLRLVRDHRAVLE